MNFLSIDPELPAVKLLSLLFFPFKPIIAIPIIIICSICAKKNHRVERFSTFMLCYVTIIFFCIVAISSLVVSGIIPYSVQGISLIAISIFLCLMFVYISIILYKTEKNRRWEKLADISLVVYVIIPVILFFVVNNLCSGRLWGIRCSIGALTNNYGFMLWVSFFAGPTALIVLIFSIIMKIIRFRRNQKNKNFIQPTNNV